METKDELSRKLQEISKKLVQVVNDPKIAVVINKEKRTISFLQKTFLIPETKDRNQYILAWEKIFSYFDEEKQRTEKKINSDLEQQNKKNKINKEEQLGYTQNLSYIQSIVGMSNIKASKNEKNSQDLKKQNPEKVDKKVNEKTEEKMEARKNNKQENFKYGICISEDDKMNGRDWFALVDSKMDFVILNIFRNGKLDKKFKSHIKSCKDNYLKYGMFFEGISTNETEAKRESEEILSYLDIYKVEGPIIYEINNKAISTYTQKKRKITIEELKILTKIVDATKYIYNKIKEKGYSLVINIDFNTITLLMELKLLDLKSLPLIYNVLPGQEENLDSSCQFIEYNPNNVYEKVKILEQYVVQNKNVTYN